MKNKKVLFIGIGFYDYDKSIIDEFEKTGYTVDYFSEVPPSNFKQRFFLRTKNKKKINDINSLHTNSIIRKSGDNYDYVFVIKCENLSILDINNLKDKSPEAKFILYLWDSINRIDQIKTKIFLFDKVYSFDRLDCLSNNSLIFNPLFFRDVYDNKNSNTNFVFDIYHLGWYHSDRLVLIKKLVKYLDQNNITHKINLYTGYFNYLYKSLMGFKLKGFKKYLIFKPIESSDNFNNMMIAKSVLDIAHPLQSGLTMRTIELLGMRRKIITTNTDIINYDFYHPNNILVINRENPFFDISFFESDYFFVSDEIRSKYSISNWLKRMIN